MRYYGYVNQFEPGVGGKMEIMSESCGETGYKAVRNPQSQNLY